MKMFKKEDRLKNLGKPCETCKNTGFENPCICKEKKWLIAKECYICNQEFHISERFSREDYGQKLTYNICLDCFAKSKDPVQIDPVKGFVKTEVPDEYMEELSKRSDRLKYLVFGDKIPETLETLRRKQLRLESELSEVNSEIMKLIKKLQDTKKCGEEVEKLRTNVIEAALQDFKELKKALTEITEENDKK